MNIMMNSVDLLIYLLLGLIENYWVIENVIAVRFLVWMSYWMYFTESAASSKTGEELQMMMIRYSNGRVSST